MPHFIGIDLAWAEKSKPNESGAVMLDQAGTVVHAGWVVGVEEVLDWLDRHAPADALLFVDAPLVVNNAGGQRLCEKEVGQRYWRWRVAGNSTNRRSRNLAGVTLRRALDSAFPPHTSFVLHTVGHLTCSPLRPQPARPCAPSRRPFRSRHTTFPPAMGLRSRPCQ
ncbi:MAG: DUF429 domain-containing protein [Gammaproteobacteria bacterium]|nr:DUF429 domain-containing protein [Gammaproteobacteria bacterium]